MAAPCKDLTEITTRQIYLHARTVHHLPLLQGNPSICTSYFYLGPTEYSVVVKKAVHIEADDRRLLHQERVTICGGGHYFSIISSMATFSPEMCKVRACSPPIARAAHPAGRMASPTDLGNPSEAELGPSPQEAITTGNRMQRPCSDLPISGVVCPLQPTRDEKLQPRRTLQ